MFLIKIWQQNCRVSEVKKKPFDEVVIYTASSRAKGRVPQIYPPVYASAMEKGEKRV